MTLSALLQTLREDEGERLSVYPDSLGYWTIGVGICVDGRLGCGLTETESTYLLQNRVALHIAEVTARYPWFTSLTDARQRAVINLHYQLGADRFASFVHMIAALARGDFETASAEVLNSTLAHQTPARATRVATAIRLGVDPT